MGNAVSDAENGVGTLLGNVVAAPFKSMFASCEGICVGTWDIACFIEHFCISNLVKLFMVLVLCYIILLFFYLMFELGICQCITRSLCKMCCAACETYWFAVQDMTCFLCHKLKNTKRVNRRRRRPRFHDIEEGTTSSSDDESTSINNNYRRMGRKGKSIREQRKRHQQSSLHPYRQRFDKHSINHDHHLRSGRRSRHIRVKKMNNVHRSGAALFKKRRVR